MKRLYLRFVKSFCSIVKRSAPPQPPPPNPLFFHLLQPFSLSLLLLSRRLKRYFALLLTHALSHTWMSDYPWYEIIPLKAEAFYIKDEGNAYSFIVNLGGWYKNQHSTSSSVVFIRAPLHHGGANVSCLCCYYYYTCTLQILFSIRRNYLAEFRKEQLAENFKDLENNSPD